MEQFDSTASARIAVTPRRGALLAGRDNRLHVLVQVQGPAQPSSVAPRPPHHLALVIDRSGSMSGRPLAEAVACARFMIDRLRPADRVALVDFDDKVRVLVPATPARDRQALHLALDRIRAGGSTNLHGGWLAGAEAVSGFADGPGLNRVIVLSDGRANVGLTDTAAIVAQCAELAGAGVSTSTYGLGRSFNEDLMVEMARAGQGSHYYGETAEDLFEPFDQEFSLLANLWARHVSLRVLPAPGVRVRLLNDYPVVEAGEAELGWRLPDVAYDSEAWAVLELTVAAAAIGQGNVPLCTVRAEGIALDERRIAIPGQPLALAGLPAAAYSALAENELVVRRVAELEAASILREARHASARGDWARVDALLGEAQQRFAGNPWVEAVLESIGRLARRQDRALFMKEALYSSAKFSTRLAARDETFALDEAAKASYLRRKRAEGKSEFERRKPDDGDRSQT
ncbi:MAG: VWA domain-containing protein [Burkholderiales bacterium]|jgi:Ca-activated chloride channel family protein|nr:VWA domain-containing protein [Burkholderiales bacterium]